MSGGVLFLYVDAKSVERNEADGSSNTSFIRHEHESRHFPSTLLCEASLEQNHPAAILIFYLGTAAARQTCDFVDDLAA
jgi:hypothetical protein